ncbi:MAG TPA: cupredoxin domain-containing protein [Allosphingosinicella sp.]
MRRPLHPLAVPLIGAAATALALVPVSPAVAAPRVHTVIIAKMKFGPVPAGIRAGDTIVWVNRDPVKHTATARDRSFNVDLPPGKSGRIIVRRIGGSAFYCIYHPGMKGTLTVGK